MKPNDLPTTTPWTMARRAARMNPSVIREILKVTEKPGIISFAGGLPSSNVRDIVAWRGAVWVATAPYQSWRPPTVDGDGNPVKGSWSSYPSGRSASGPA